MSVVRQTTVPEDDEATIDLSPDRFATSLFDSEQFVFSDKLFLPIPSFTTPLTHADDLQKTSMSQNFTTTYKCAGPGPFFFLT
jgi:hypothetical protein